MCKEFSLSGHAASASETVETAPEIADCTEHKGPQYIEGWSMAANGCNFVLHPGLETSEGQFEGTMDLGPPSCGPLTFTGQECEKSFYPQSGIPVAFSNEEGEEGRGFVKMESEANLEYLSETPGASCGPEVGWNTLLGTWSMTAANAGGAAVSLGVIANVPGAPSAGTSSAGLVGSHGGTLRGWVNPNGAETEYQFEYGLTAAYGSEIPASPELVGSGDEGVDVSQILAELKPNTTYHFRIVASSADGVAEGADRTFTTQRDHAPRFEAEEYPTEFGGEQDPEDPLTLIFHGTPVTCEHVNFEGELAEAGPQAVLEGGSDGCVATIGGFLELPTSVDMNSCSYEVNLLNSGPPYSGSADITCGEGDAIEVLTYASAAKQEAGEPLCSYSIGSQSGREGLGLEGINSSSWESGEFGIDFELGGIAYTSSIQNSTCGQEESGKASYDGEADIYEAFISGEGTQGLFLAGEESEEQTGQPRFEVEGYPAELGGQQDPEDPLTLIFHGTPVTCEHVNFEGELAEAGPQAVLEGGSDGCVATIGGFLELPTSVDMNSCSYEVNLLNSGPPYSGSADITCGEGDAIEVLTYASAAKQEAGEPLCSYSIGSQSGLEGLGLEGSGQGSERAVGFGFELSDIGYVNNDLNSTCGEQETGTATYSGGANLGAF